MKELNRDELLRVKGGVEIEGYTWGHFADDSVDSNGYCYGQPEDAQNGMPRRQPVWEE